MFATLFAWAQGPVPGYVNVSQETPLAGLMTLGIGIVFVGWIVFMGVRGALRIRREERQAHAADLYSVSLDDLGPTMADGGEPIAPGRRKGRTPSRARS
jgi:hypothetical protein